MGLGGSFHTLRTDAALLRACSRVTSPSACRKGTGFSGPRGNGEGWEGLRIEKTRVLAPALRPGQPGFSFVRPRDGADARLCTGSQRWGYSAASQGLPT